ncbi:MAG: hypothetical protein QXW97_00270 [Candidatus Pacearchaeota archaeon]
MLLSPKFQIVYNFKRYVYKSSIPIYYMVKRKRGDRSGNILNELNLVVLRTIKNNPNKDIGVGDLKKILRLSHMSLKQHVRHLVKIKLITINEPQEHGKRPLKITNDGEKILEIFDRNLQKIK